MRVNHEIRILNVAGIVRPQDVDAKNMISYDRIAEARISYGGRGRMMEMQAAADWSAGRRSVLALLT